MKDIRISLRTGDIAGALIFIVLSVIAFLVSLKFLPPVLPGDPGAAFFPRLIVAVIFLFSLILLIQRLRETRKRDENPALSAASSARIDLASFGITAGSVLALIAVMAYVGFELAAFGFLFILLGWRTGRWVWACITSVVSVALMYFVFVALLKVQLPMMFLPKYLYL